MSNLGTASILLMFAALGTGSWLYSHSGDTEAAGPKVLFYQDPMHPAYRSDKPGVAPDCGMQLVPVYAESPLRPASVGVRIDEDKQKLVGIRVVAVEMGGGSKLLRMPGRVAIDTSRLYIVNAPADGWFTSFLVNVGDTVAKDQMLGAFYSRELRAGAAGYLAVLDRLHLSEPTVDPTRTRSDEYNKALTLETLHNLGVSDMQIHAIERTGEIPDDVEMHSPARGVVVARNATPGQRFNRGEELSRIADLNLVWIVADLFREDAGLLQKGAQARIRFGNRSLTAKLVETVPEFDPVSQTEKVRFAAENPGLILKPEMFVDMELSVPMPPGLTVPREAVLDSGSRQSVFVATSDNTFEARQVETGWRAGERVQILKGLSAGDQVVVSGQFLIDSETRLQAHP